MREAWFERTDRRELGKIVGFGVEGREVMACKALVSSIFEDLKKKARS